MRLATRLKILKSESTQHGSGQQEHLHGILCAGALLTANTIPKVLVVNWANGVNEILLGQLAESGQQSAKSQHSGLYPLQAAADP